jgi:hypothetical protein
MRALTLCMVLLAACIKPVPADLLDAQPALGSFKTPRACTITVGAVQDARPDVERVEGAEGTTPSMRYFLPLLLWFQWETSGPRYTRPDLYAGNLLQDLQTVIGRTIDESALCAGGGPNFELTPTLHHYSGLSYEKSMAFVSYGGGAFIQYAHFPVGQVELEMVLSREGQRVGALRLGERYLFNPGDRGNSTSHAAVGGAAPAIDQGRKIAPRIALERLLMQVPDGLDRVLAEQPGAVVREATGSFLVVRLTREYDFQEEMLIETATGRIITDQVVRRRLPVLGSPGEWVVAPLDAAGRWMSAAEYRAFVAQLARRYRLVFEGNLTAARFEGMKGGK